LGPHDLELSARIGLALILGAAIGLERQLYRHPAGLRTMAMVSVGSCLFTVVGAFVVGDRTDPTRIAAQVVSGVGFLGAGAILRSGIGVRGLTTAATIWVVAAIGMAVGFGFYFLALVCTVMVIVALVAIKRVEERFLGREPAGGYPDPDDNSQV
jgi:putative Mg2+ transporter-C (MgtC) family protein